MARRPAAAQGVPHLDGGALPRPGMHVLTFTGHRGTVAWSTTPAHSASRHYPAGEAWHTLVTFPDAPARQYATATLRPDPEPPCPSSSTMLADSGQP